MKLNIQLFGGRGASSSSGSNNNPKERYIKLIVDNINKDYEQMSKEEREEANTFQKYLDVMGYDSSKDFKEDIQWLALNNDNTNYRKGLKNAFNFDLTDAGEIELKDGSLYSYRKAITEARKRIKYFNKYLDDDN